MNPTAEPLRILIVDDNPDFGELLTRSLRRKFPQATLLQAVEGAEVTKAIESIELSAIVVHRAFDADAESLVKEVRAINAKVPLIVMSGIDRSERVLAAGATGFLHSDQWLLLGSVVANAIAARPP